MITYREKLNLSPGGIPLVVHVSQYDQDFTLVFELYSSKGVFTIESGTTVQIRGTKTDGEGYSVDASLNVSSAVVTVTGDQQMTAAAGRNVFELTLWRGGKELNTANFILDVERAALDKDTIGSQSVIKELVAVIDRTDEIISAARRADAAQASIAALTDRAETAEENASTSANNAANSARQAEQYMNNAKSTIDSEKESALQEISSAQESATDAMEARSAEVISQVETAVENATTEIEEKSAQTLNDMDAHYQEQTEIIDRKAEWIANVTTNADEIAIQALSTANNAENHMATLDSQMQALEAAMQDVSIDPDDLGLYQDADTYYVYPTYKGIRSENGIPLAGGSGGGGGGGGDVINAKLTVENTTGWLSKTIPSGSDCPVSFVWSSIEDDMPTGDGNIRITVNEVVRASYQIKQGSVLLNLAPYLSTGTNKVKVRISDVYDQGQTTTFNVTAIALSISSTFDTTQRYSGAVSVPYTPIGAVEKTVYAILDGQEAARQVTSVSGRQMSFVLPQQSHGAHSLRLYFEAVIDGETVRSNELYYEFVAVVPLDNTVIITSSYDTPTQPQYSLISIPFMVYDPANMTAEVQIYANNVLVSTQTVDRTEQSYIYRANDAGALLIEFKSGGTTKAVNITITESEIDVEPETQDLRLYLTSEGRSNNEENPWTWVDEENHISAVMTGFDGVADGWVPDDDGVTCLRVSGNARVSIPYNIFGSDVRLTGLTVEIEYATGNVADYNAVVLSCYSDNRGLTITPQRATLRSEQTGLYMQYKENEHVRVAFTVDKRSENRLVKGFIDGIVSRTVQYPSEDDFSQVAPVGISIGSDNCTIDIYNIRVYANNLTMQQVLNNWIADTQDGALMLERYTRNQVYDAYGSIVIGQLPSTLPYMIIEAEELPQYKGDKKTVKISYTDPLHPSKSFTAIGVQINVQGTSSAPYYRKNFDLQFKNGFDMNTSGHADKYKLRENSIPTARFVIKADVASSESANNTQLVRLYNDICPYKTPEMLADSKVRWGIDGFPIVVFWHDTATGETKFHGKYNFNFPKRFPEGMGYNV